MNRLLISFCISIIAFSFIPKTFSTSLMPVLDRHLVKESDVVFVGEVKDIKYQSYSSEDTQEKQIPFTFVYCAVNEILKGKLSNSKEYVIRFTGGPTQDDPDKVLHIDGIPLFDIGDSGIFFVRGNGTKLCPMVGWRQGFARVIEGKVYSDYGNDLFLSHDPILAARIHPMDIRDYDALIKQLSAKKRNIDQIIFKELSEESQLIIQDISNIQKIPESKLNYIFPASNDVGFDLSQQLLPLEFRAIPRTIPQVLLYRDLNILISQRHLFSSSRLEGVQLRPKTSSLLQQDQKQLPIEQILLLNRRVLEDVYPTIITKSMDDTAIYGPYHEIEDIMINQIGNNVMREIVNFSNDAEKLGPQPEPPDGERLSPVQFISHLKAMVQALHTVDELSKLPIAQQVSIQDNYIAPAFHAVEEQ